MENRPISASTTSYFPSTWQDIPRSLKTFTIAALSSLVLPLPLWKQALSYRREQQKPLLERNDYYFYTPERAQEIAQTVFERRGAPSRTGSPAPYLRTTHSRLAQRYRLLQLEAGARQLSISYCIYAPMERRANTPLYQSRGLSPLGPALIYAPDDIKATDQTIKLDENDHTFAILHHMIGMQNKLYARPIHHAIALTVPHIAALAIWGLSLHFVPAPVPLRGIVTWGLTVTTWGLTWAAQKCITHWYQKKAHEQVFATDRQAMQLFLTHVPPPSPSKQSSAPSRTPTEVAIHFIQSMAPPASFYNPSQAERIRRLQPAAPHAS